MHSALVGGGDGVSGSVVQRCISGPIEASSELSPTSPSCLGSQLEWLAGKMSPSLPRKAGGARQTGKYVHLVEPQDFPPALTGGSCRNPGICVLLVLLVILGLILAALFPQGEYEHGMKAYVLRYESTCTCSNWGLCAAFPFPVWRRNQ